MASVGVRSNICVLDRFASFIHPKDNESLQFPRSISAIFQRLGENMLPTGGQQHIVAEGK